MIERTLALASPYMTGEDVKRAEYVLNGHNKFKQDYLQGEVIDNTFGPMAAQACYRAHYWAGFSLLELATVGYYYGTVLDGILAGDIKLSDEMAKRRNDRTHALTVGQPLRERAFAELLSHLGATEHPPGSQKTYATAWYGMTGAWCAMAVTEAYVHSGSKSFVRGQRYAWVPAIEYDAKMGHNGLAMTRNPKRGDLCTFDWNNDGEADHVSLFDEWETAGSTFRTVGGNEDNAVRRNVRNVSDLSFRLHGSPMFVHVGG